MVGFVRHFTITMTFQEIFEIQWMTFFLKYTLICLNHWALLFFIRRETVLMKKPIHKEISLYFLSSNLNRCSKSAFCCRQREQEKMQLNCHVKQSHAQLQAVPKCTGLEHLSGTSTNEQLNRKRRPICTQLLLFQGLFQQVPEMSRVKKTGLNGSVWGNHWTSLNIPSPRQTVSTENC